MFDFDALSHAISSRTVLCVGDLMLDEFVYGEVSRISPEAPAPVIAVQRTETNVGGAGNVPSQYCFPQGLPMMMNLYDPMEIVITAERRPEFLNQVPVAFARTCFGTTRLLRFAAARSSA